MVDMSHYEKEDNLAKTKELVAYCHERGIATEAEPGRIEGGEDGIADTGSDGHVDHSRGGRRIYQYWSRLPGSCIWKCSWRVWTKGPTARLPTVS
jgi:fructose/tagatose bisphosphate aldolase